MNTTTMTITDSNGDVITFPVDFNPQEKPVMPARKHFARIDFRIDAETLKALEALQEFYGADKNQSDIIREAIVEKAKRDLRRKKPKTNT